MANRYDRDSDDYGFGRRDNRDTSRDDDDRRSGQYAQDNRYGDNRQSSRQNPWRDVRHDPWRSEQENRGRYDRDYGDNNYYSGREQEPGRDYYSSGRDYHSSYGNSGYAGYRANERDRGWSGDRNWANDRYRANDRNWQNEHRSSERQGPGNYRGVYQEQIWTRDPSTGNVYGYEYSSRVDPRRFNQGDESRDRWRSENEQNRRFDIDRGWYTPGTSGYGNQGFQSQYGKGPKGYTRSDERIREDVCDRLSDDDEVDARDITVTVKNAEVILEGTVQDRRSKHRAEDVAESVSGVKEVTNQLRARKGFLQELGDKISGDDDAEHHGHRGTGTRNSTAGGTGGVPQKTSH
jgi:osmotically-inducible protein OsmY